MTGPRRESFRDAPDLDEMNKNLRMADWWAAKAGFSRRYDRGSERKSRRIRVFMLGIILGYLSAIIVRLILK